MKLGKLVSVEGLDGAGKSTQVQAIRDYLESKGQACVIVSDPGGTEFGSYLRTYLKDPETKLCAGAEAFGFAAARRESLETVVIPALEAGVWVIYDRFIWSTRAYQGAGLNQMALVRQLETATLTALPFTEPVLRAKRELVDLVIYLRTAPELALQRRMEATGADKIESRGLPYYKKVYDQFEFDFWPSPSEPHRTSSIVTVDARRSIHAVTGDVLNAIDVLLTGV